MARGAPRETIWTDATHARLIKFWTEGLSTAEIGRRLGTSKNSIIGKARRLHLPQRPSPIRPSASGVPYVRARPPPVHRVVTLPNLVSLTPKPPPAPIVARPAPIPAPPVVVYLHPKAQQCAWLNGQRHHYVQCVDKAWNCTSPYCHHHHRIAYVRVPDRRYDAA